MDVDGAALLMAFTQLPVPLPDSEWEAFANRFGVFTFDDVSEEDWPMPEALMDDPRRLRRIAGWPNWRQVWEAEIMQARRVLVLDGVVRRGEPLTLFTGQVELLATDLKRVNPSAPALLYVLRPLFENAVHQLFPDPPHAPADPTPTVADVGALVAAYVDARASRTPPTALRFMPAERVFRRVHFASGLLSAVWTLIDAALQDDVTFKQCAMGDCSRWVAYSRDGRTGRGQYCKDNCRNRAAYGRRQQALELARQGASTVDIASAIGSAPATVERWL